MRKWRASHAWTREDGTTIYDLACEKCAAERASAQDAIGELARKYGWPADNNFAAACYNNNSLAELRAPHAPSDADPTDCDTWGITPEQWGECIEAALEDVCKDKPETKRPHWAKRPLQFKSSRISDEFRDVGLPLEEENVIILCPKCGCFLLPEMIEAVSPEGRFVHQVHKCPLDSECGFQLVVIRRFELSLAAIADRVDYERDPEMDNG